MPHRTSTVEQLETGVQHFDIHVVHEDSWESYRVLESSMRRANTTKEVLTLIREAGVEVHLSDRGIGTCKQSLKDGSVLERYEFAPNGEGGKETVTYTIINMPDSSHRQPNPHPTFYQAQVYTGRKSAQAGLELVARSGA